ncbi:MAG: hypothetical protein ACRERY_12300, partial [Pseudomonas sp.]
FGDGGLRRCAANPPYALGVIYLNMTKVIAKRELLYSLKGESTRRKLIVNIGAPYLLEKETVGFNFDPGAAGCTIEFDGLIERSIEVHGIDLIHALQLAADIDQYLKGMQSKYDFYWSTGEPYFE